MAVIASLTVTSLVLAVAGRTDLRRTLIRSVTIGMLAMGLTLLGGTLSHG